MVGGGETCACGVNYLNMLTLCMWVRGFVDKDGHGKVWRCVGCYVSRLGLMHRELSRRDPRGWAADQVDGVPRRNEVALDDYPIRQWELIGQLAR